MTNLFQRRLGTLSMTVEQMSPSVIKLFCLKTSSLNSISIPVKLHYSGNVDAAPPCVKSVHSRLLVSTSFHMKWAGNSDITSTYKTNVVLLNEGAPSRSSYVWTESVQADQITWDTSLQVSLILPPTACSSHVKGTKVLLPSFRTCWISRAYEIELKFAFDYGGNMVIILPITVLARPATASAQAMLKEAFSKRDHEEAPSYELVVVDGA